MLHKKPLNLAVSVAIGASAALSIAPAKAQQGREEPLFEEVVVTGSRIQRANLVSSSPVTQLDSEQLRFTGLTRVEDALAAIPAISLDQSSGQAIEATGIATLQLRNLGAKRTLVLMNGRRLPAGTPSGGVDSSAADINLIPGQLVERVEVLTGGASSTYGADAVAGVVNFIMQDDFEGLKFDYQTSINRHDNGGNVVASAARAAGQPFASGTSTDGEIKDFTLILGGNLDSGRGNITSFATYREIEGVTQAERGYSACPVRAGRTCLGSATNASGSVIPQDPNGTPGRFRVEGNELLPGYGPGFNFAAPSYFQRPDERIVVGTFAHYDLNEHIEAFTELMFMDTKSTAQFGPAGNFFTKVTATCANPLMSDQQRRVLGCKGTEGEVAFLLGRRNVEGGPRFGVLRHTTYRGVFGVRGDIDDAWRYEASWQYSEVDMRNRNGNYFDTARLDQALNAIPGKNGAAVCGPDADPGCVPYDLFNTGGVSAEQLAFLSQEYFQTGTTSQEVFHAYAQGSLGDYGVVSPFAENGVELVVGYEYREETLRNDFSDNAKRGVVGGLGAALVPVSGRYDVNDLYFEASLPLIEGATLAESLVLDVGYRYSDYSFGPSTDTYKFAGNWVPIDSVRVRGSFQRAVRAPNVVELFEPANGALFGMDSDPCNKENPGDATSKRGYTFEQCARSGVSRAVWDRGGPSNNPAAQYNQIGGGNTDLQPEEADTLTAGVIWTPEFIDGLSVSLDWYDIEIEGAIQGINEEVTLLQCIETGAPRFCNAVSRGINDTLWLGLAQPGNGVDARVTNIGLLAVQGIDIELNYSFDVGDLGSVNIANIMGIVDSYEKEEYAGAGVVNCEGAYGGTCAFPIIDFQNRMQATWAMPRNITASLIWRHIGAVDHRFTSDPHNIDAFNYFDISATWDVTDYAQLRVGLNNILDEEPPFVYQGVTSRENGNTYPGIYDPLGQYLFAGFTVQF